MAEVQVGQTARAPGRSIEDDKPAQVTVTIVAVSPMRLGNQWVERDTVLARAILDRFSAEQLDKALAAGVARIRRNFGAHRRR